MSVRHPERASGPFRWLSLATVAFLAVVIAVAGAASYKDLTAARAQETALHERVEETRDRVEALERQVERLTDDPETLERVAREELGLVRPDDIVVVLPEERLRREGKRRSLTLGSARSLPPSPGSEGDRAGRGGPGG